MIKTSITNSRDLNVVIDRLHHADDMTQKLSEADYSYYILMKIIHVITTVSE